MAIKFNQPDNDNLSKTSAPSGLCGIFHRAAAKRAGQISALGLTAALMTGCATSQFNVDTCMRASFTSIGIVGGGSSAFDPNCGDAKTAEVLMRRQNDPVSNALGFLLYLDQNPDARAQLQQRMGGAENVQIEPAAVADLLAMPDTSRYVGVQIYAKISPEDRQTVDSLLRERGIDPKAALTLNDDDRRAALEAERLAQIQAAQAAVQNAPQPPQQCRAIAQSNKQIRFVCGTP